MMQIASDSGLLPAPVAMSSIELWPAGEDLLTQTLTRFDVVRTAPDDSQVPDTLRPLPPTDKPVAEREFVRGLNLRTLQFEIHGKVFHPNRVDEWPRLVAPRSGGSTMLAPRWSSHTTSTPISPVPCARPRRLPSRARRIRS